MGSQHPAQKSPNDSVVTARIPSHFQTPVFPALFRFQASQKLSHRCRGRPAEVRSEFRKHPFPQFLDTHCASS